MDTFKIKFKDTTGHIQYAFIKADHGAEAQEFLKEDCPECKEIIKVQQLYETN